MKHTAARVDYADIIAGQANPRGFIYQTRKCVPLSFGSATVRTTRRYCSIPAILCVIDRAKALYSAIRKLFQDRALIQRCQWHKREDVLSYLPKSHQATWRKRLQRACEKPTHEEAKAALNRLKPDLKLLKESALSNLEEGLEGRPLPFIAWASLHS